MLLNRIIVDIIDYNADNFTVLLYASSSNND